MNSLHLAGQENEIPQFGQMDDMVSLQDMRDQLGGGRRRSDRRIKNGRGMRATRRAGRSGKRWTRFTMQILDALQPVIDHMNAAFGPLFHLLCF